MLSKWLFDVVLSLKMLSCDVVRRYSSAVGSLVVVGVVVVELDFMDAVVGDDDDGGNTGDVE